MEIKKVVFDIDDILWGLNQRVADRLGYNNNYITNFLIHENKHLSTKLKNDIIESYHDLSIFENIQWYEGISEIVNIEQFGTCVFINSNCMTKDIADSKKSQLLDVVDINPERIRCNVIKAKNCNTKIIDDDTDILIDDSPFNIAQSKARLNILINHPWNISEEAIKIMEGKDIIRFNNLREINEYLKNICKK